jgi:hypothetical protein
VSYTPKKWALTAVFGIAPLFISLVVLATVLSVKVKAREWMLLRKMNRVDAKSGMWS